MLLPAPDFLCRLWADRLRPAWLRLGRWTATEVLAAVAVGAADDDAVLLPPGGRSSGNDGRPRWNVRSEALSALAPCISTAQCITVRPSEGLQSAQVVYYLVVQWPQRIITISTLWTCTTAPLATRTTLCCNWSFRRHDYACGCFASFRHTPARSVLVEPNLNFGCVNEFGRGIVLVELRSCSSFGFVSRCSCRVLGVAGCWAAGLVPCSQFASDSNPTAHAHWHQTMHRICRFYLFLLFSIVVINSCRALLYYASFLLMNLQSSLSSR